MPEVYTNSQDPEVVAFQEHQKHAARPRLVEEARTMVSLAKFGVLSTMSVREETHDLPNGSVVEFATNALGHPVFATSSLSSHCSDLTEDGRASLTVLQDGFQSIADRRITLLGRVRPVTDTERAELRDLFLKKYPDAFYVDFADFKWFIMDDIVGCRYFGGFGGARKFSAKDYSAASVDPVAVFSPHVCGHMNNDRDHRRDMQAVISDVVGLTTEDAEMVSIDRLGMNFKVMHKGQSFALRLPFPEPAEDRVAVKQQIVKMVKAVVSEDEDKEEDQ